MAESFVGSAAGLCVVLAKVLLERFCSVPHAVAANWQEVSWFVVERETCEFKCPWFSWK